MARNTFAKKEVDTASNRVTFKFSNGKTLVADLSEIQRNGTEIATRLALHGLGQKVGDSYAGADTVDDAIESASDVLEMLVAGKWTERTAGEPRTSVLAEALSRVMTEAGHPKTVDECAAVIKEMDDAGRKTLRDQPAIKAAMSAIKAERDEKAAAEKPFDPSALFGKA